MQQLSKALTAKYQAAATLKALLPGGFWDTEVPQDKQPPYAVFQLIGNTRRLTFSDNVESLAVQMKIYSDDSGSSAPLDAILKALLATFDFCTLSVDDHTFISMQKVNILKNKVNEKWEYLVLFQVILTIDRT